MTECEEVASQMAARAAVWFATFEAAYLHVCREMPDESMTVRTNVAWALYAGQFRPAQGIA